MQTLPVGANRDSDRTKDGQRRPAVSRRRGVAFGVALLVLFALAIPASLPSVLAQTGATGIVATVAKAPIDADGNVTGRPTDVVITLDGSLDPNVPGRSLAAGDTIKVTFPAAFDLANLGGFPLAGVFSGPDCSPGNLLCTTAVLLQGWPQHPIPPPPNYALSIEGNTFVFTATADIAPNGAGAPGIKQMHLILNGVENPAPGSYKIEVEAETGAGGNVETGSVMLNIIAAPAPSINVTSVFAADPFGPPSSPPNPNTIYQTAATSSPVPLGWSFLVWGADRVPYDGIALAQSDGKGAQLVRNGTVIGTVSIISPAGATGQKVELVAGTADSLPAAPVIGPTPGIGPQPVGRLDIRFTAGSEPGTYVTTLTLVDGNQVQMFVNATGDPLPPSTGSGLRADSVGGSALVSADVAISVSGLLLLMALLIGGRSVVAQRRR